MHNTQKDRFENKLIRFMREFDKTPARCIEDWDKLRSDLLKKYGFTDEEWYKACRLVKSWTSEENGLKKTKRFERKKMLRDKNRIIYRSDIADNPNGEAEIKAEDEWVADVFDTDDYDEKDMAR
jgi:hypothetical protein